MKIGTVFPHQAMPADPQAIRDWAQAVEDLGYSHILAYDHVLGAMHEGREPALSGPYTERDGFHELMVLLGYLAACTSRVELASGVLILPQRQTALVAKQAAQIQILSQGRLRLGVGTGWNYVEYDSLGEDFNNRGERMDEQVDLLRTLLENPVVGFFRKSSSHRSRRHPAPAITSNSHLVRRISTGSLSPRRAHRRWLYPGIQPRSKHRRPEGTCVRKSKRRDATRASSASRYSSTINREKTDGGRT